MNLKIGKRFFNNNIVNGFASILDITGLATTGLNLNETAEQMIKKYLGGPKDDERVFKEDMEKATRKVFETLSKR